MIHPGFLLGRRREVAIDAVVTQLAELRERLEAKGRDVDFGVEVMGRVRDLGSLDDVLEICHRVEWVRPVLDFAHLHAVSDGGYLEADAFAPALRTVDVVLGSDRAAPAGVPARHPADVGVRTVLRHDCQAHAPA